MYIEDKSGGIEGPARIGRVIFSNSMRSLTYRGKTFHKIKSGFKSNFIEEESQVEFWISGPKQRGGDRLYGTGIVEIDEDVREEYWTHIRGQPSRAKEATYRD
jgi:hypothetical protein